MAYILTVDDDRAVLTLIRNVLRRDGHMVEVAERPDEIEKYALNKFDLILLDVMMPGENGFDLCQRIRERVDCPIVFLTAKVMEEDVMQGFGSGGDDYILKPFRAGELRARVNAHIRREHREKRHALHVGEAVIYMDRKELAIGDAIVHLTKSEFEICEFLARHRGSVFTKDRIYDCISDYQGEGDSTAVVEHIKNIRAKLKKYDYAPIETVWGMGYKWQ